MDSRTILEAVDDAFVTTGAGTTPWPDPHMSMGTGWSASGRFADTRRDVEALISEAREGRSKHRVVHGARWW